MIWAGKKVLITAGPTQEAIDPVRYISNHSSGKMGYSIAAAFADAGAEVILVSGPTHLEKPVVNDFIQVTSAQEMYEACANHFHHADYVIFCAAVADYRPKDVADEKIKKSDSTMSIELVKNIDIAGTLGPQKAKDQVLVGFALETENELKNAQSKLQRKNLDLIILNSLRADGAGFGHDTNKITIIESNKITEFELKTKKELALDIISYLSNRS